MAPRCRRVGVVHSINNRPQDEFERGPLISQQRTCDDCFGCHQRKLAGSSHRLHGACQRHCEIMRTPDLLWPIELERPIESRLTREVAHMHGRRCRPKIPSSRTCPLLQPRTGHELASLADADSTASHQDVVIGKTSPPARTIRTHGLTIGQQARFVRD